VRRARAAPPRRPTTRRRRAPPEAALYRIAQEASAATDLRQFYAALHTIVGELMSAPNFYLALYDPVADRLHFPYYADEMDAPPPSLRPGRGLTEYVLRTGEPLLVDAPRFAAMVAEGAIDVVGTPAVDWLGVPLRGGGRTFGVVAVQSYRAEMRYGERDKEVLTFVAQHIAATLERRRAEEERERSLSLLRAALESTTDGLLMVDLQGRVVTVNHKFQEMWHLPAELVDAGDDDRLLSFVLDQLTDPEGFLAKVRELYRQPDAESYDVLAFRDGRVFERYSQPQRVGGQSVGRVWSFRDVTDRRRSEERYRSLFEESLDAVYVSTPAGRLIDVNPAGVSLFGYSSKEELLRVDIARDLYADPAQRERWLERIREQGFVRDFELETRTRDGRRLVLLETSSGVRDEQGRLVALRGFLRDVTEQRQLEDHLRQAQKMEAVGQLAGGVAHDFNNLLTVIFGYSDLVLAGLPAQDPMRADVEEIRNAGRRAGELTRQLLAFGRRQVLSPRLLDLNRVVGDMEKLLRRLIGEHIELVTRLDDGLGVCRADPGQIEQVIVNLAVNARDAMPDGGRLVISTANAVLEDEGARRQLVAPGVYVLLQVSDTGVGMDEGVRERIFEPFFTTKELGQGTGLGLATVYGIVKQSGGHIAVESQRGEGSAFSVYLPRAEGVVEPTALAAAGGAPGGRESILLVEDEEAVRALVARYLRQLGYRVLEASDGPQALAVAAAARSIDLLLTDMVMPRLGGAELAARLRAARPGLPVLFVSGHSDQAQGLLQSGALGKGVAFLQKPYSTDELARRLRELLDE